MPDDIVLPHGREGPIQREGSFADVERARLDGPVPVEPDEGKALSNPSDGDAGRGAFHDDRAEPGAPLNGRARAAIRGAEREGLVDDDVLRVGPVADLDDVAGSRRGDGGLDGREVAPESAHRGLRLDRSR